jgi:hypothetical protein
MSKYSTTLGSTLRLRGTQLGRVGGDARALHQHRQAGRMTS